MTDTGSQYAGLTALERAAAMADDHMPECDEPRIEDCANCRGRLRVIRRVLEAALPAVEDLRREGAAEVCGAVARLMRATDPFAPGYERLRSAYGAALDAAGLTGTLNKSCDQCDGLGWVRIKGQVAGAICGYETAAECAACNPDGRIPYAGQIDFD